MSEWKTEKIGNLIHTITKGTTPNKTMGGFSESGVNYIKSESISYEGRIDSSKFAFISELTHQQLKRSQLQKDDILFSMAGAYLGKSAIVTEDLLPANTNQALAIIRLNQAKANPRFVNYFFRHPNVIDYVNNLSGQSAQPNINFEEIKSIEIDLPSLTEQKAIASVLSSLDDKIDLLHRQNKTLEAMAETLFRQWFIEEAKEDWEKVTLGDIVNITSSKRIFYSEYVDEGIPFYRSKEIIELNKSGQTRSELFISNERFDGIVAKFGAPVEGDILLTSVGTLGVTYQVKASDRFYFKDGNLTWFKDFKHISSNIIFCWLNSKNGKEQLDNISIGSTQAALTIQGLKSLELSLPSLNVIQKLDEQLVVIYQKVNANQSQIQTLEKLRDTLLPKLMSGEVRVQYQTAEVA